MRIILLFLTGLALAVDSAAAQEPTRTSGTHFLEPGDIVRLRIWREEAWSGDHTVDAEGVVVFPRLGARVVTGKDPAALKNELMEEYARYLRSPAIEVTFLRRVLVGGAVQRPGIYHIEPTLTVRDAVLLAGGATATGRMDAVELVRDGEVAQARLRQDLSIAESSIRSGDQLYVPEKNWFARNTNAVVGIGGALLSFAATMIILAATN